MYLLVLIVGALLLSPALSLTCYYCSHGGSENCTSMTINCPKPNHHCASVINLIDIGDSDPIDLHERNCALTEQCTEMSINFGSARKTSNVQCCTTDLCNDQPALNPNTNTTNGKKCYQCQGNICDIPIDCLGSEDSCFTRTSTSGAVTRKGCISRLACDPVARKFLLKNRGATNTMECCQGDFCNGVIKPSPEEASMANDS